MFLRLAIICCRLQFNGHLYLFYAETVLHPIILIPARMGATRLPRKPLADIGGKPMIVHVAERAMRADIGPVYVACDDAEIAWTVENAGARALLTRPDHASGSDRIWEALQQIDPYGRHDIIINVQGDMPTLDPRVIAQAVELLEDTQVDIATLVAEIREEREKTDPAVVKAIVSWQEARQGKALYFTRATAPYGEGPLYHHIGLYAYRRQALQQFMSLPVSPLEAREKLEQLRALEAGMHIGVALADTVPLGVDTPETLDIARRMYAENNL